MSKKTKKNKPKVVYYDDHSTIADMSNVSKKGKSKNATPTPQPQANTGFKAKFRTYWRAVQMMIKPMCIAIFILVLIYLILFFLSGNV